MNKKKNTERFNQFCGMGQTEYKGKQTYVVFADPHLPDDIMVGRAVGKGNCEKDALVDAIKNLVKHIQKINKSMENIFGENGEKITQISSDLICLELENPVIEINKLKYDENKNEMIQIDEIINADVFLTDENELAFGIA